ncbi:hypothetical protein J2S90_003193 [Arthrobacter bambusae]|uniref:Uncharacterized protein n=1 Tax=Arthrobacter bambusae TaxID=1338426 RepID=A0AAW8DHM8_9MICC|nr:hypothetical protein [Arthrobacter bambusae]MDQ0130553.1 hypothetical protein [Arthrobacter bambusae]MDQ0182228.1 hypothetical protein [Arthrobacter bambusae]
MAVADGAPFSLSGCLPFLLDDCQSLEEFVVGDDRWFFDVQAKLSGQVHRELEEGFVPCDAISRARGRQDTSRDSWAPQLS